MAAIWTGPFDASTLPPALNPLGAAHYWRLDPVAFVGPHGVLSFGAVGADGQGLEDSDTVNDTATYGLLTGAEWKSMFAEDTANGKSGAENSLPFDATQHFAKPDSGVESIGFGLPSFRVRNPCLIAVGGAGAPTIATPAASEGTGGSGGGATGVTGSNDGPGTSTSHHHRDGKHGADPLPRAPTAPGVPTHPWTSPASPSPVGPTAPQTFDPGTSVAPPVGGPGYIVETPTVTGASELVFLPTPGVDRPDVVFAWDTAPRNIRKLSNLDDGNETINVLYAQGRTTQGADAVLKEYTATDSVAEIGVYFGTANWSFITTEAGLDAYATEWLNKRADGLRTVSFEPISPICPTPFDDFNKGDTVRVAASWRLRGGFFEKHIIVGWDLTLNDEENEIVSMVYTDESQV